MLKKFGLLDLINDPNRTEPVQVAVTFDGGKVSRFWDMLQVGSNWWISSALIQNMERFFLVMHM
jgi:hypothetical protein